MNERRSFVAGLTLIVLLALILPVLLCDPAELRRPDSASVGAFIVTSVSSIALGVQYCSGSVRIMQLAFWLYCYLFLGLAAMVQITSGSLPLNGFAARDHFFNAFMVILAGMAAWWVGYRIPGREPIAARTIVAKKATLFAAASIAASLSYIGAVGLARLFSSRVEKSDANTAQFTSSAVAALFEAIGTVPIVVAVFALILIRQDHPGRYRALLIATSVLALAVNNPVTSSRSWIGSILLTLIFTVGFRGGTPRRFRSLIAIWLFAFIVVFPQADVYRYAETQEFSLVSPRVSLVTGDFDSFVQIARGVQFVEANGTTDGRQALGTALFFVPRQYWADKPEGTGGVLAQFARSSFTNLSAPLWTEGYIDFGILGSLGLLFGWGIVGRRLDDRFIASTALRGRGVWFLGVPLLAFWQIVMLRGSLIAVLPIFVVILLSVLAVSSRPRANRSEH